MGPVFLLHSGSESPHLIQIPRYTLLIQGCPMVLNQASVQFSLVQSLSHVQLFLTPWTAACQASLSIANSWSLFKLMSIESVMPSNHLILYHPFFLPPSIFPSTIVFSNESFLCIKLLKSWSFSFSISPYKEYSGLISFRMEWLDLLAVQGTLKSLLQHHSSKASILWCSTFFIIQISHLYVTPGKTIVLTRQTFVGKVTSLIFNMLSSFYRRQWSISHPRKRNAKRHNGCLRRSYK